MDKDALFAKQPIFDADNNLFGYEILYRNTQQNQAFIDDGVRATMELMINYCSGLIDEAIGPYVKIFVNLNRELIMSDRIFAIPPERLVFEVLEDTVVDVDLLVKVSELKNKGYSFALGEYKFAPHFDQLISLLDYIKLDTVNLTSDAIVEKYNQLNRKFDSLGSRLPVFIAEKVETEEIHQICKKLGFSLFQGYFLACPKMVFGKKLEASSQNALRLVSALQQPDITINEVARLVSQDVRQSYLILKIVNSPICHFPRKIESIHDGITFLGLKQIKQWVMVFALTGNSEVPLELFRMLFERAKTCEIFASEKQIAEADVSFTAGLFSGLDLVLGAEKNWLLTQLALSQEVVSAILDFKGAIGKTLETVIELEKGELAKLAHLSGKDIAHLMQANFKATKWANELFPMIKSSN